MVVLRGGWERLVELWDLSGLASIVSRALTSLYMIEAGLPGRGIDVERLARNIKECKRVLERLLEDLESYAGGGAPETELVTLLVEAYGDTDVGRLRKRLERAIRGAEKLAGMLSEGLQEGGSVLGDRDVAELEELLRRLSDVLGKKVERMAGEIYAF